MGGFSVDEFSVLALVEGCAGAILENEVGLKAILIDPDGKEHSKSALKPDNDLKGFLTRESLIYDANSGVEIVAENPVITFRNRSLERMPQDGEKWIFRIQVSVYSEDMKSFALSVSPTKLRTLGFTSFNLQEVSQL